MNKIVTMFSKWGVKNLFWPGNDSVLLQFAESYPYLYEEIEELHTYTGRDYATTEKLLNLGARKGISIDELIEWHNYLNG